MTAYQRQILTAVYDLERERRGPVPMWLVAVAVNAGTEASRDKVNTELLDLRQAGLLRYASTPDLGKGLCLADAGCEALAQTPPEPAKSSQSDRKPLSPKAPPADEPPSPPVASAPDDDDAELDLIGYQLMVDLAKVVLERLRHLGEHDPDNTIERMRLYQLAQRFMSYFERLEAREEARAWTTSWPWCCAWRSP